MPVPLWLSLTAVSLVVGLGVALVVWLVRSELRERRQRRAVARFLKAYRGQPRALPAGPGQKVTVDELVAKVEAEGLPVRLNWDEREDISPDEDEWPTAVLPRVEIDEELGGSSIP